MTKYNHAFDIAFEVVSEDESGENIPRDVMLAALLRRVADITEYDNANFEAVFDMPFDTYEIEEET